MNDLDIYRNLSLRDSDKIQLASDIFTFIYLAFSPFIVILNFGVIFVVSVLKNLTTPYDYFLITIATADVLVGLVQIPLYCFAYNSFFGGQVVSEKYSFWSFLRCFASLASLRYPQLVNLLSSFVISIERSVAVNWPFRYSNEVTHKRIQITVYSTWLVAILLAVPSIAVFIHNRDTLERSGTCNPYLVTYVWILYINDCIIVAVCVVLPFFLNLQVLMVVRRQWIKESSLEYLMTKEQRAKVASRRKLARYVFALIYLYIVLWLPYFLILLFQVSLFEPLTFEVIKHIGLLPPFINSIFHAPAFTLIIKDYRIAYKAMMQTSPINWVELARSSKKSSRERMAYAVSMNPLDAILHTRSSFNLPDSQEVYNERKDLPYLKRHGTAADVLYASVL